VLATKNKQLIVVKLSMLPI